MPYDSQQSPMRALYNPTTQPAQARRVHHDGSGLDEANTNSIAELEQLLGTLPEGTPEWSQALELRDAFQDMLSERQTMHRKLGAGTTIKKQQSQGKAMDRRDKELTSPFEALSDY